MIRLTVLYNLPPGTDEDEFLHWRMTEHQENNASMPGVIRTDFCRIDDAWPDSAKSPYRFMTIVEWADKESFEKGFYDEQVQAGLRENVKKIDDQIFLISEVLIEAKIDPSGA